MARSTTSRVLTDHDEIREWAEERNASPACVRGTGGEGDTGMIRLDFPGYSGGDTLEEIDWDEWLEKFDEMNLALLVQDETASGEQSNFNKLIGRETAKAREQGNNRASRRRSQSSGGGRGAATKRTSATAKKKGSGGAKKKSAPAKKKASTSRTRAASKSRTTAASKSTRGKRAQTARGRNGSRRRAA